MCPNPCHFTLREEKLILESLLSKAGDIEASKAQAKDIEVRLEKSEAKSVQFVKKHTTQKCYRCGFSWLCRNKPCPAREEACRQCGKTRHFAKVCKSRLNLNRIQCHRPVRINFQFLSVLTSQALFIKFTKKRKAIKKLTAVTKKTSIHARKKQIAKYLK